MLISSYCPPRLQSNDKGQDDKPLWNPWERVTRTGNHSKHLEIRCANNGFSLRPAKCNCSSTSCHFCSIVFFFVQSMCRNSNNESFQPNCGFTYFKVVLPTKPTKLTLHKLLALGSRASMVSLRSESQGSWSRHEPCEVWPRSRWLWWMNKG